jgi:nicotinate phosphoribosyltransferase
LPTISIYVEAKASMSQNHRPEHVPALLLDLYELTMAQSYVERGLAATEATFSLFTRDLPPDWGFFLAAGLDDVLTFLERLSFSTGDLDYLASTGLFSSAFLCWLGALRFTGSVRALPEGTIFFPQEPLLEVTAPLVEAQIVESAVLNEAHFQSLIASKAVRCVLAAQGRRLVDFSLRRTHGTDAAMKVARSAYIAGFAATSNVSAGQRYATPIAGTMAHSYVQTFPDERTAFSAYARTYPDSCVLLVDTYDTLQGTRIAADVGRELAAAGHRLRGVRLDSGDLAELSFPVRKILDQAGLHDATIFTSGGLDEHKIAAAVARSAPIDAFGVGSCLGTSADAPYLDMAYKLVAYADQPVLKLSTGKATWPGPKQVWRRTTVGGDYQDRIGLANETGPEDARPLLVEVMRSGRRLHQSCVAEARVRVESELAALPPMYHVLRSPPAPPIQFTARLQRVREAITAQVTSRVPALAALEGDPQW